MISWITTFQGYNNKYFSLRKDDIQMPRNLQSLFADHARSARPSQYCSRSQPCKQVADPFTMKQSHPLLETSSLRTATQ